MLKNIKKTLLVLSALAVALPGLAQEKLTVFAAASMTNVLQDIGEQFKKDNKDTDVVFSFASSSVVARQINEGAPADIFVSANQKWMNFLEENDKIVNDSRKTIAGNTLVLIAPKSAGDVKFNPAKPEWVSYLGERFLAVGDPDHVPAGNYAKTALTNLDLWGKVESKLARAANVRAALALVERGESPLGIVYATDAAESDKVQVVGIFPQSAYNAIEYPAAIVKDHDSKTAQDFMNFLGSEKGKETLTKYGFSVK
ncbi:molybdate ABC transporter substrate-binding protein [Pasteurellaceae bacterium HPA106]|uniref:molybdate ABC transporter substrate-binding protein n=1 Tax=Spirabiliibacterium pneumoniae TaxID=221400 RepID=UPI001AADF028|nr:molybdate ABC transporter substrate-binding protein [Spirabiliibacterium pneumoniae]MBE2896775.1 molybdate ABC transporter substrate-binding protein [Spirabiliibacterium pneumoniae]